MTQTETTQVKVLIEANGLRYEAYGPVEHVIPQILQFLSQSVPAFDLAKKLIYVSDLAGLADRISEFSKMTHTGQLLLTRKDISADLSYLNSPFHGLPSCQDGEERLRVT